MLLLTNFSTLFIVTVQQDTNPPDADVDIMDFLVHAACGPCQTENCDNPNNTQEIDIEEEEDEDTDNLTP